MRRGGPFLGRTSARGQTLGSALRMAQTLLRTPLHDRHLALGARLVPFAGWEMPVQYEGVIQEHRAVRSDAGVFDVSHMGEIDVEGPRAPLTTGGQGHHGTLRGGEDRLGPKSAISLRQSAM